MVIMADLTRQKFKPANACISPLSKLIQSNLNQRQTDKHRLLSSMLQQNIYSINGTPKSFFHAPDWTQYHASTLKISAFACKIFSNILCFSDFIFTYR
jgi:hypothetical protein